MTITLDTTLGTLLDDPQAKAVLDEYLPGVSSNPLVAMAKGMSLKMILAMPQAWPDPGKGRGDTGRSQQAALAASIPRRTPEDDYSAALGQSHSAAWPRQLWQDCSARVLLSAKAFASRG